MRARLVGMMLKAGTICFLSVIVNIYIYIYIVDIIFQNNYRPVDNVLGEIERCIVARTWRWRVQRNFANWTSCKEGE